MVCTSAAHRFSRRCAALPNAELAGTAAAPSTVRPSAPLNRAFFMGSTSSPKGVRRTATTLPSASRSITSLLFGLVPVAAVFEFGRDALDAYDQMLERHADVLGHQPHRRMHVCFETDDGYMVVDVWDSLEDFEEFGEVLQNLVTEFPYRAELKLRTIHKLI